MTDGDEEVESRRCLVVGAFLSGLTAGGVEAIVAGPQFSSEEPR